MSRSVRMKCRYLELFIKILSVNFILLASERDFGQANESIELDRSKDDKMRLAYVNSTGVDCPGCVRNALTRVIRSDIQNHRLETSDFHDKGDQVLSRQAILADEQPDVIPYNPHFKNESFNLNLINDTNSQTIYSSLVRILTHLKQQLNRNQNQIEDRADRRNSAVAYERPSNKARNAGRDPGPTTPPTSQAAPPQPLNLPPTTTMEVYSEPLDETGFSNGQNMNGNDLQVHNNTSTNQGVYLANQFDEIRPSDSGAIVNSNPARDSWPDNRMDLRVQVQRNGEQPVDGSDQQLQVAYSQKMDDKWHPPSSNLKLSNSIESLPTESVPYSNTNKNNYIGGGLSKPLFVFSTSTDKNPFTAPGSGTNQEIDPGEGYSTLSANGLNDINQKRDVLPINGDRFGHLSETAIEPDTYDSAMSAKRPKTRHSAYRLRSNTKASYQRVNGPSYSGEYPYLMSNTGARSTRATDYSNAQRALFSYAADQQDVDRAQRPIDYQDSQRSPRLEHTNIHLQQILPNPISASSLGYQQYQQPQQPQQQQQHQNQHQQQSQQQMVYHVANAPTSSRVNTNNRVNGLTSSSTNNNDQMNSLSSNNDQHQQRDLLNQPQTIQITAVPNGGFNTQPIVRVNGALGVNGLVNNGLFQPGFTDPFGRPLVMLNAERRQIDWSVWIWPLLVAVSLPILLGALFVPIFLKTVIVIIQVLQSLGLLQPITNALTQQISKASGAPTSISQPVEQAKT